MKKILFFISIITIIPSLIYIPKEPNQHSLTLKFLERETKKGLSDITIEVRTEKGNVITLVTDENGIIKTPSYNHREKLIIKLKSTAENILADDETYNVIIEENAEYSFYVKVNEKITNFNINEGKLEILGAQIPVDEILQNPELPTGCEITSLTGVLNYLGFNVDKMKMADEYLPRKDFYINEGRLYGANPNDYFVGNPRSSSGFYCFTKPIVKAANDYLLDKDMKAIDISGSKKEEIVSYIKQGIPVIIWSTIDLETARNNYFWYINDNKYFAYTNLHCMILTGFSNSTVTVIDPLKGKVKYEKKAFFESYEMIGRRAIIIKSDLN